jgi:hypothetical protein
MNQESFEAKLLELWITTRIPFTRANLQFATRAPRRKLEGWLRELTLDGVLDTDVDEAGELVYTVRGAERSRTGPVTVDELERLTRLEREARAAASPGTALVLNRETFAAGAKALTTRGPGEKSLLASGILSFFFGPLGWLYAGHWKEALPAAGILILLKWILPSMLLVPLLGVVGPVSAGVGVLYAWKYNRSGGERQKLLPAGEDGK